MRILVGAILATSMIVTSAFADVSTPLAAGKPAGVKKAQDTDNTALWVVGLGVVAAGIALVASGDSDSSLASGVTTTSTTSSTSTQ